DVVPGDELPPVEVAIGEPEVIAREIEPGGDVVRHRNEPRLDARLRVIDRDVAVRPRMRLAHPSEPDTDDPDRLRHLPTPVYGAEAMRSQTSGLTRRSGRRPSTTAMACSKATRKMRALPSTVPDAMCGVTTTSSRWSSGWPTGSGSGSVTSR